MNFNKYHVSKNLFDASVFSITYPDIISMSDTTIDVDLSNVSTSDRQALYNTGVPCAINAPFTISFKGVAKTNSATNGRLRLQFDDDSTDELYVTNNDGTPKDYSEGTFNKNLKAIKFNWSNYNSGFAFKELMINSSSEALPYEPYGNTWRNTPHYIMGTATDTLTALPADIYANDTTATVGLKGNMFQTGTPTPSNPIQQQETGERTAQLFEDKIVNCSIDANGNLIGNPSFDMYIAKVEQGVTYTASASITGGFYTTKPTIGSTSYNGQRMAFASPTVTAPITGYMTFRVNSGSNEPMFNEGSTALPYEPYGYFIEIEVS